jgi:hypothetical protein
MELDGDIPQRAAPVSDHSTRKGTTRRVGVGMDDDASRLSELVVQTAQCGNQGRRKPTDRHEDRSVPR